MSVFQQVSRTKVRLSGLKTANSDLDGSLVLRDLRRRSLLSLLDEANHTFTDAIEHESEALVQRLMKVLSSMMTTSSIDDALAPSGKAKSWAKALKRVFMTCLRTKAQLALSERFYEFYIPPMGSESSTDLMMSELGGKVPSDEPVEICLMPAVIEYQAKDLGKELADLLVLSTDEIFVRKVRNDKVKGNVVSPAIVVLGS